MAVALLSKLQAALKRRFELTIATGILVALLESVLAVACVLALRENTQMRQQLTRTVHIITPSQDSLAPPLIGEDQTGASKIVQFQHDRRPTVVFTFMISCPYCQDYWRAIQKLQALPPGELRLIYIDTHDQALRKYLSAHGAAAGLVMTKLEPEAALAYRALLLPQVEVISGDGRVQWSHAGEMTNSEVHQLVEVVNKYVPDSEWRIKQ